MDKKVLFSGNEAIARGAIESGVGVATAYPGTPSTEILEYIAANSKEIHAQWSVNEKVALETAVGASYSGLRAICSMKHVGVNVAADPLITLAYTGVKGGLLIVAADDPGMHSSQNEQDTRYYSSFAKILCLEPCSSQEARDMTVEAFRISEETGLPVMLRTLTRVAHTSSPVALGVIRKTKKPHLNIKPKEWVMIPAHARVRHRILNDKQKELLAISENSEFNKIVEGDGGVGVIACGSAFNYVMEFHDNDFSVLKISTYPLPIKLIRKFLKDKEKIIVFEEGEPFVEDIIRCNHGFVVGRRSGDVPLTGELTPEVVSGVLEKKNTEGRETDMRLPVRPPVMCPGCPHRSLYVALKKAKPTVVTGDIGCYTLGVQPPLGVLNTCLCMGAGIGQAAGMSHSGIDGVAAVIGESTFLHSGITSLMNAVYNKADILVIILDNSTVAMTGHQPNPATGVTARGDKTRKISIEDVCKGCGVDSVTVVDPYDIRNSGKVIQDKISSSGVNVIVSRRPCVILKGVSRGTPYMVDPGECTGCGKCFEVGCPAISFDGKAQINADLCRGCGTCAAVCPFGAIKIYENEV